MATTKRCGRPADQKSLRGVEGSGRTNVEGACAHKVPSGTTSSPTTAPAPSDQFFSLSPGCLVGAGIKPPFRPALARVSMVRKRRWLSGLGRNR